MTLRPPPLPKHEGKYGEEILNRVEEGWQEEDDYHAPGDKRNIAEVLNLNKKPNCDSHVSRDRGNTIDTNERIR